MVEENGYILDIDNIMKFCCVQTPINENEVTEQIMKIDLFKSFLNTLIEVDINNPSFGERIMINTMINEGLLKEINEE